MNSKTRAGMRAVRTAAVAAVCGALACAGPAAANQIITLRSGQVGGLPGLVGQPDDIVTCLAGGAGVPLSNSPFTAADFSGAVSGGPAHVIAPYTPFWVPGISDPQARWINFNVDATGYGTAGSCLYAVPFFINPGPITSATLNLEYAVDDVLGDSGFGGPNTDGLYINGIATGYSGGGYSPASTTFQNITSMVTPGWNYMYLYQRDAGVAVSGIIFSARIDVAPAPGPAALLGLGGLVAARRRR
jgi:MYXO-CTERM domain-containing protein